MPEVIGVIIIEVNRCPQLVSRQAVPIGQKVPGVLNGALLEIIAEGKITEHLKKRMVPGRIADILQVIVLAAGAYTFLGSGGPGIVSLFFAKKNPLELNHSRVDKKQGGIIVRYKRRAPNNLMVMLFEIFKKFSAYVVSCH